MSILGSYHPGRAQMGLLISAKRDEEDHQALLPSPEEVSAAVLSVARQSTLEQHDCSCARAVYYQQNISPFSKHAGY